MDYNFITNIENCHKMIAETVPATLVYYSHIPTAIISLLVGFFVFLKSPKLLAAKILLGLTMVFSLRLAFNFVAWMMNYDSSLTMITWSFLGLFDILLFVIGLYFVYVFIDTRDVSFFKKILFGLIIVPILLVTPTRINLLGFSIIDCEATETNIMLNYVLLSEIIVLLWVSVLLVSRYIKSKDDEKAKIKNLFFGIIFFFTSFFISNYYASYIDNFDYELYGIFGMTVFMGFLAYLIVKFKAFNIKMLAAQVLVAALVILVGSEFFFIPLENTTSVILLSVTVLLATIFGIWLINSVKNEVKRKEELQLMSDNLAVANDKLKKLDNAKSEFISIASHQLRTPLTSIKGYISLITEGTYGAVSAEVKDALSRVYLSNERLIKLVENLLNVSRIESGRMEYTWEKGSAEGIIMGLLDDFIFAAKKNGLYLNAKMPDAPLPLVRMDKAKLTEVISNTIDNAIKYTKKGGVTVQAELEASGKSVRVTVSDTGIGIPKENMDEMFQKFSRGKDTTRLHATGTGLGMFVAKNIIEAHQGKIWVESEGEGKGSRFIIELPVGNN